MVWQAYPEREPPGREAPEPVSPPAMARMEVEKHRLVASGRAALMIEVRNMVDVVMGEQLDVGGEEVV